MMATTMPLLLLGATGAVAVVAKTKVELFLLFESLQHLKS